MEQINKLFSAIFNIAAIAGFLAAFAVVVGVVFFSYRLIDTVSTQARAENVKSQEAKTKHPIKKSAAKTTAESKSSKDTEPADTGKALLSLSEKLAGFNAIDLIERDLTKTPVSPICKIICNESNFNFEAAQGPAHENPLLYLHEYYKQERGKAFADPNFRIALETASAYSGLVPPPARQALLEVGQAGQLSEVDKLTLSAKLPVVALKVGTDLAMHIEDLQARANRASEMKQLRENCSRKKPQEVVQECQSL